MYLVVPPSGHFPGSFKPPLVVIGDGGVKLGPSFDMARGVKFWPLLRRYCARVCISVSCSSFFLSARECFCSLALGRFPPTAPGATFLYVPFFLPLSLSPSLFLLLLFSLPLSLSPCPFSFPCSGLASSLFYFYFS